jgi:hypothetical protein
MSVSDDLIAHTPISHPFSGWLEKSDRSHKYQLAYQWAGKTIQ